MQYSSRIFVAALLILSASQASFKALALPVPSLVAQASPAFPVLDDRPDGTTLTAQSPPDTVPGEAAPGEAAVGNGAAGVWWWIVPLLAGLGGVGWFLSRRGGATPDTPSSTPAPAAPPPPESVPPTVVAASTAGEAAAGVPVSNDPVVVDNDPVVVDEVAPAVAMPEPDPAPMVDPGLAPEVAAATPDLSPLPVVATAGAAGLAVGAMAAALDDGDDQSAVEASKFDVVGHPTDGSLDLSTLDDGLPPLPEGYGDSRIVLMPRDPQWAYTYWDTPHIHKEDLRRQGGERLALRLYDVTDMDRAYQAPHSMQQFDCDELARDWYLPIPLSDRDYQVELGYLTAAGGWLVLASSNTVRVPPIYPSDWSEDHFRTVTWGDDLRGQTLMTLVDPQRKAAIALHEKMYALSQAAEEERIAGSLYGSMQHVPGSGQHVAGSVQHVAGSVQHVAGSVQHVPGSGQHVAGSVQHVAGSVQHVPGSVPAESGAVSHIAGSVQHVAGSVQHIAGSVQHVAGSVQHVPGSVPIETGGFPHVAGSVQHVAGSVQHIAGSVQHVPGSVPYTAWLGGQVAGSVQHVAGSIQHVAGSVQHVAGSVQHIAGSVQHVPGSAPVEAGGLPNVAGSVQHIAGSVQHMAGSVQHMAGSVQHLGMVPGQAPSSYAFASGAGMMGGAVPTGPIPTMSGAGMMNVSGLNVIYGPNVSGLTMSGAGLNMPGANVSGLNRSGLTGLTMSGAGLNVSGLNMSGLTMSGVGFWSSMPPIRPRKFWLVADAELIIHGATEPDATVTIGGQPIRLSPDGTFRFKMVFPDGRMDYPIMAVAVDGEQNRFIHMTFNRDTPERHTNTKEDAQDEWFPG